jgi:hypothetical protein
MQNYSLILVVIFSRLARKRKQISSNQMAQQESKRQPHEITLSTVPKTTNEGNFIAKLTAHVFLVEMSITLCMLRCNWRHFRVLGVWF